LKTDRFFGASLDYKAAKPTAVIIAHIRAIIITSASLRDFFALDVFVSRFLRLGTGTVSLDPRAVDQSSNDLKTRSGAFCSFRRDSAPGKTIPSFKDMRSFFCFDVLQAKGWAIHA